MKSRPQRARVIRRPRPTTAKQTRPIAEKRAGGDARTGKRSSAAQANVTPTRGRRAPRRVPSPRRPTVDTRALTPPSFARLGDAPEELQRRVTYRFPWVQAVQSRPRKTSVNAALREHARVTGVPDADIPARTTVLTWVRRFEAFGRIGLLDGLRADAGTKRALATLPKTAKLTHEAVDTLIGTIVCGAKGKTIDVVHVLNQRLTRLGHTVAYPTVWRWVDAWRLLHPHDVHFAHAGAGAFAEDNRLHLGMAPVAPGVMHSFDSSPADEQVRVPDPSVREGWRLERPVVTRVIDVCSRVALSFEVTIGSVSADIVLGVLRRCYCPGENWEGLPTVPLPKVARADTGPEHRGAVEQALRQFNLSTDGQPLPPEARAHIERLHRTLGERTSRAQLGRTTTGRLADAEDTSTREHARGRRARVREERRAELPLMAFRTLDEFIESARLSMIAYNRSHHSGVARDAQARRPATRVA